MLRVSKNKWAQLKNTRIVGKEKLFRSLNFICTISQNHFKVKGALLMTQQFKKGKYRTNFLDLKSRKFGTTLTENLNTEMDLV